MAVNPPPAAPVVIKAQAPSAPIPEVVISETDKPFILVMIATIALFGVAIYAVITRTWTDAKDMVEVFMPLLAAGWGLYFSNKQAPTSK